MCNKTIQHTSRGIGKTYKSVCKLPEFKNGLCKKHYTQIERKTKNWIDREEYREATEKDLLEGRSLKLKHTNQNRIFQCRKGIIKEWKEGGGFFEVAIPTDPTLFCVLNY